MSALSVKRTHTPWHYLLAALSLLTCASSPASDAPAPIELASTCPPGFELTSENHCTLHSLYDQ